MSVIISDISKEEYDPIIEYSIERLGETGKIQKCKKIVIKPNLCCDKSAKTGATTDPKLTRAVIKYIKKINPTTEIRVIESSNRSAGAKTIFRKLGYNELEKIENVSLVNITNEKKYNVEINGKILKHLRVPLSLLEMDYYISIAKMKTNVLGKYSGIMKNQYGCLTSRNKTKFHPFTPKVITDLNMLYTPNLCIIDGCPGMEGFGPVEGNPIDTGLIIIGNDPLSTDIETAKLMGFNPKSIAQIRYAEKHGLKKFETIEVINNAQDYEIKQFNFIPYFANTLTGIALWFQGLGVCLGNLASLIEKVRSAMSSVGVGYVNQRLDYRFGFRTVRNWIYKIDG